MCQVPLLNCLCRYSIITGGLVCCGVRDDDLKAYHGKMVELEKTGHWKLVKQRKVPYYDREDMPTESTAFVYKVLKH